MGSRAKTVTTVRDLLLQSGVKFRRAGVILYTSYLDTIYFGLGRDHSTHDLTDFGGGVKKGERGPEAALREFAEESLVFQPLELSQVLDCVCVHDGSNLIVFVSVQVDPTEAIQSFKTAFAKSSKKKPEVCGLMWVPCSYFIRLIEYGRQRHMLYSKVRRLLYDLQWLHYL